MVESPLTPPMARPLEEMVATLVLEEDQMTELVTSCVLLSVYVPVAVNFWVTPWVIVGVAGVTAIELNAAVLTTRVVLPVIEPEAA